MAGNFFPTNYKEFPFKEGDLLASQKANKKYSINKVLRVDEICLDAEESISIQGKEFTAPEKDCLLIVSMSYGENEFNDLDELKIAAERGTWTIKVDHIPNRAPGAALGQKLIGFSPVTEEELVSYNLWKSLFNRGKAGIF